MKLIHVGGQTAGCGTYLNVHNYRFVDIGNERLPGGSGDAWLKVPDTVFMLAAPLMGLAYVVLFPLVGAGAVVYLIGYRIARDAARLFGAKEG